MLGLRLCTSCSPKQQINITAKKAGVVILHKIDVVTVAKYTITVDVTSTIESGVQYSCCMTALASET